MGSPVVHFEVIGQDAARLQRFYGDLFGWKIDASNPMGYGLVDTGSETGIQGGVGQSEEGGAGWVTFYVEVEDIDASLARAESLGGATVVPRTEVPGMVTLAILTDPEGHHIGLVEPGVPPAPGA